MDTPPKAGYVYNVAVSLGDGQSFTISGNFPVGASLDEMNGEIDKVMSVAGRQRAKVDVIEMERHIEMGETILNSQKMDLEALDKTYEGRNKTTSEKASRDGMVNNIRRAGEKLESDKNMLEDLKKKAE